MPFFFFLTLPSSKVLASTSAADAPLWPFNYTELYRSLAEIGRALGIALVPNIMRHSGVTIDRAENARSAEECQKRGRWKQASSMRRYEKSGRLGDSWRLLRPAVQVHCRQMTSRLPEFVVGGAAPPRIPAGHTR